MTTEWMSTVEHPIGACDGSEPWVLGLEEH